MGSAGVRQASRVLVAVLALGACVWIRSNLGEHARSAPLLHRSARPGPAGADGAPPESEIPQQTATASALEATVLLGDAAPASRRPDGTFTSSDPGLCRTFTADGLRLTVPAGEARCRFLDVRMGDRLLSGSGETLPSLESVQGHEEIVYPRGGVTERYVLRADGVEQVIVLDRSSVPQDTTGDLKVGVGLESSLRMVPAPDHISFKDESDRSVLTFGSATAIDARGATRSLTYHVQGSRLEMVLDAAFVAKATFPLSIDPTFTVTPSSLTFNAPLGGPNPAPLTLKVKNTAASGTLKWKATVSTTSGGAWLTASPAQGVRHAGQSKTVTVAVNMLTLAAGTYTGNIHFADKSSASNAIDIPVTLSVLGTPFISLSPTSLTFNAPAGSGLQPVQTVTLTNLGGQTLSWSAGLSTTPPGGTWLTNVSPSSGSLGAGASTTLSVTVDATSVTAVPGAYTGTLTVTGAPPTVNSPQTVGITLNVISGPFLDVNPTTLSFSAPAGNPAPIFQNVTLRNSGGSPLNWSVTTQNSSAWLTVTPTSGTGVLPGVTLNPAFQVTVSAAALAGGTTYTDTILIGGNATNATPPFQIPVSFTVESTPAINVAPTSLAFNAPAGGPDPAPQTITVSNQGGGTLTWTGSIAGGSPWLSINQTTGSDGPGGYDSVEVLVTVAGLAAGQYSDIVNFDDGAGTVLGVFVQLSVNANPQFSLTPSTLVIDVPLGGSPATQPLALQNVGSGALAWSAVSGAGWLSVGPASGSLGSGANVNLTVTADPTGLSAGSYVSQLTFNSTSPTVTNSPQIIGVTLNVNANPKIQLSPTSLVFDVPRGGAAAQQTVTLQDVGGGAALSYSTSAPASATWLGVTPATGTVASAGTTSLTVTATPGSLVAGSYTALVTVSSSNATNSPQQVFVTMNVNANPKIQLSPGSLEFDLPVGAPATQQTLTLTDVGDSGTPLAYATTATTSLGSGWLAVTPANGNVSSGANTPLTVTVTPGALAAGTYTGEIHVASGNGTNAPQVIPVVLNLSSLPRIGISPGSLAFTTGVGTNPPNQPVTVSNTGGGTLGWSASSSVTTPPAGSWLSLSGTTNGSLASGASAPPFNAVVDVTGLAAGTYSGTISVAAAGSSNTPQTITVTLNVTSSPAIGVSPTSLTFTTPVGTNPGSQPVTVSNTGGTPLDWSAAPIITTPAGGTWLSLSGTTSGTGLAAGTSAAPFNVVVDVTGLAGGTYSGTVEITGGAGTSNSPQDIPVTLQVLSDPTIGLSPTSLVFTVTLGTGNPINQPVTVTNTGDQTLTWSAAVAVTTPTAGTWLGLSGVTAGSLTGGLSASFDVTVDVTGLPAGSYTGTLTVTGGANTTNSPQTIGITLVINTPAGTVTVNIPKAGYCGSVGLDLLLPLGLMWTGRKLRRRLGQAHRKVAIRAFLTLLFALGATVASLSSADEEALPRSLSQDEAPQRPTTLQPQQPQEPNDDQDMIDLKAGSVDIHAGILTFSSKFKAHVQPVGGVELRAPSPLLSGIVSSEPDRIGFLLDLEGSSVKRNLSGLSKDSGGLFFATAALDGTFYRDDDFQAQVEAGIQYGYFGGVTGLKNGVAGLVGLRGALWVAEGVWITLNPQATFAKASNHILFLSFGVDIGF